MAEAATPLIAVAAPNPKWPAFRDELDAAVRAAEGAGDVVAWTTAVRRRCAYGDPVDVPAGWPVSAAFHAKILAAIDPDALGGGVGHIGGRLVIRRIPITVRED